MNKWVGAIDGSPLPHDISLSFEWWVIYNDKSLLPYPGGVLDQPQWVLDDFHYYNITKELRTLPYQIAEAKREREKVAKSR